MSDGIDSQNWPGDEAAVLRLGLEGEDVDVGELLKLTEVQLKGVEGRAELAKVVVERQKDLLAWLGKDPEHERLLLETPVEALSTALGIDPEAIMRPGEIPLPPHVVAGTRLVPAVELVSPETTDAITLLKEVADDAATRPDGYETLAGDTHGVVARVAAGRYSRAVVQRTSEALLRSRGAFVSSLPATLPSGLLTALRENVDLDGAVVNGGDDVR